MALLVGRRGIERFVRITASLLHLRYRHCGKTRVNNPKIDLFAVMKRLLSGEMRLSELPPSSVERLTDMMKSDADALQKVFDERVALEKTAPKPGTDAPDFNLELIDPKGIRTGEMRALSDHLDKPVALLFGSYT